MKLSILLKKLAVPVMALAMVGMLAACSTSSGGGSGSGDDTKKTNNGGNGSGGNGGNGSGGDLSTMFPDPTGDYFVKCDGAILFQCEKDDFDQFGAEFTEGTHGTLSSDKKTFTLNDAGLQKFIGMVANDDPKKIVENPVAVVIYKNCPLCAIDKKQSEGFSKLLTNNTDYKAYKNGKIIVLTDAGLLKMMSAGN